MNMDYLEARPFFHHYEGPECVHGLNFADESEARLFWQEVQARIPRSAIARAPSSTGENSTTKIAPPRPTPATGAGPAPPPRRSTLLPLVTTPAAPATHDAPPAVSPRSSSLQPPPSLATPPTLSPRAQGNPRPPPPVAAPPPVPPTATHEPTPAATSAPPAVSAAPSVNEKKRPAEPKRERSFFAKIFSKSDVAEQTVEISAPREFRHQGHVGWDPDRGFDVVNIPPEWKKLFAAAKIKKSELKNPETGKIVMETIVQAMGSTPAPAEDSTPAPRPSSQQPVSPHASAPPVSSGPPPTASSAPPAPPAPPRAPAPPPPPPAGGMPKALARVDTQPKGSFLAEIQKGKELRRVEVPDISNMDTQQQNTLVDTLANVIQKRREAIATDDDEPAEPDDDNWSV